MQILLQVVPSFANYQVWWPYKTDISTLHELHFRDNLFFFFFFLIYRNNLKILRLKLTHVVILKHVSDKKNRKF